MKALTIHQPWASLIIAGVKRFETRPMRTHYRGTLAIHAGKADSIALLRRLGPEKMQQLEDIIAANWRALYPMSIPNGVGLRAPTMECLPRGVILGTVEVVDCLLIVSSPYLEHEGMPFLRYENGPATGVRRLERALGDFTPGRYAWQLESPVAFPEPIPWRGKQGLWNMPDEMLAPLQTFEWTCGGCGTVNPRANEHCPCELEYDRGMVADDR